MNVYNIKVFFQLILKLYFIIKIIVHEQCVSFTKLTSTEVCDVQNINFKVREIWATENSRGKKYPIDYGNFGVG